VLGIYAELHAAKSIGLHLHNTLFATLILLSMALLGARMLHVLPLWHVYRHNLKRLLHFSNGGASMYGGLLVAIPASFPLLAAFDLPFGSFWDVASFTMLVGMVVTRVGCFLNGCCCGRPTLGRWGLNLPNHEGVWRRRIPMQMWEAAWGIVVLVGGVMVWRVKPFEGALFSYAVGAYGLGRLVLESFRDKQNWLGGFSVHKAISIGLMAVSISVFASAWLR
jgi:phosphatidylglycerol---prolipoprotein diacylglyceryl transferase